MINSEVKDKSLLTENEFVYYISPSDFKIVKEYLHEVYKRSEGACRNQKRFVRGCLNYIRKDLEAITMPDVKDYLENEIDNRRLKLNSKETCRSYLKSFFFYVQARFLINNINFINPVPIKKVFQFDKHEQDFKKITDEEEDIFSKKELLNILELSKKHKFRDFIFFCILIVTGMRLSECLTIKIENISLKRRFIQTGFVKDARKSDKALLFFFPKNFAPFLEKYIRILNGSSLWLFPGKTSYWQKSSWYNYIAKTYGIEVQLGDKKNYYSKYTKSHSFRRTLITRRLKNGCPLLISEMLMNHKSSSVEGMHYFRLSIRGKRDYYDKWFPYYDFPYF
ncbi:MAG: tyrosine-type recombinase/integrase [Promethearchaeota archaeon]